LQSLANELPDAFTDHKRVTKSHIPAVNAPERVQVTQKATNSIVSPNPRKRGDLRVLRTKSRGDVAAERI
jgi:hypothetical protein